ncbi:hypothetical protein GQ602_007231 [Ophiocordyceps camponoti-floridani]|uniref:Fungal calcium binding protein domain-containing protein n=1 Tax=Ophiocordyceps camponoti-floridani TaxID=2030778 RepID=A0A8H4Q0U2_9HYPO|nr:hypothetical protein GQ602_007231 [Ophiocordyceps camponoti-floridani]
MKSAIVLAVLASSAIAAPSQSAAPEVQGLDLKGHHLAENKAAVAGLTYSNVLASIETCTAVCSGMGAACLAACALGGPIDPFCDICAGPTIDACLKCMFV